MSHAVRSLVMLAVLSSLLLLSVPTRAQTPPNDLKPVVTELAPTIFKPGAGQGATETGSEVVETNSLAAGTLFTDLMVRWQSTEPAGTALQLDVRVSQDNTSWSRWASVAQSDDPLRYGEPADTHWSDPINAGAANFYQLRMTLTRSDDGARPTLSGLQVHTVDARLPQGVVPQPSGGGSITGSGIERPAYVSRTGWGNPQGESAPDAPPAYYTANHLVVHHTADANSLQPSEPNWGARVRAIWSFHTFSRGWGDIGYNWMIDPNGVIYAGRAGSTDLSRDAVGFHDTANYGSMGVSMLGTYTTAAPTKATQDSLVRLLAWKASQRNIDPLGRSYYYGCARSNYCAPFNSGAVVANISGHRQVTPGHTTCPGDKGMEVLQSVRQRVYDLIHGRTPPPPDNGDLTIEETESTFSKTGDWHAQSCGSGGQTLWTYTTNGSGGVASTNSGTWRPNLSQTGQYKVLAHIPQGCRISPNPPYATTSARYEIRHADGTAYATVDHNTEQEWVELGTFSFNSGNSGTVKLTDLTSEPYSARKVIFFDAVKWIYQTPPPPTASARLISARLLKTNIMVGEVAPVEFTIQNGPVRIDTQAPDGGTSGDSSSGWVYDEGECFLGNSSGSYPDYPKETGRLRAVLGIASGSVASSCNAGDGGYPWRWGLSGSLQPNERRTIVGYVRFRTPGVYSFKANLINEYVRTYGSDGNGAELPIGSITVSREQRKPELIQFDGSFTPQASVYQLLPAPDSLLARTENSLSLVEGAYVGGFQWDGRGRDWGAGGPLGQTDRFVVRQVRTFTAPVSGTYRFRLTSDDGSWLWVDGAQVATNPGLHPVSDKEGSVFLSAGVHTIAVKFFENAGSAYTGYSWQPPDAAQFTSIPWQETAPRVAGIFKPGQQVVLAADDLGGSGVKAVRYRVNDGPEQQSVDGRVQLSLSEGTHTIRYYAVDWENAATPESRISLTVDSDLVIRYRYLPQMLR